MAGNFPYVLALCLSSLVLFFVAVWVFSVFKQMMNCKNDPMIRCAVYTCPDGTNSETKFGVESELANNCRNGGCENICAWGENLNANECMSKWCDSNGQNEKGEWNPVESCYGRA